MTVDFHLLEIHCHVLIKKGIILLFEVVQLFVVVRNG